MKEAEEKLQEQIAKRCRLSLPTSKCLLLSPVRNKDSLKVANWLDVEKREGQKLKMQLSGSTHF